MEIIKTLIKDLLIIAPRIFKDDRGYFFESWNKKTFKSAGITNDFVQDNESQSSYGVVRGLHYQLAPFSQAKLVRVLSGSVLDVAVDLRKDSPTFGKWHAVELTSENKLMFLVPRGFAHGFAVLSEKATFAYKCDNAYNPQSERSINPFDSTLNIDWKIDKASAILSAKDKDAPDFSHAKFNF
ncbi:dTDP-4-dehydrorhamnose 3,5-epimerase [Saccharicrinis sp. FJH62]|uniref:dTDP-4-dehydrorhamnose 3,5-epimerase n=1 Tax=Saccharicrinis sp. FJH62 TaxID=3344657 RepID=UPI0035D519E6